MKIVGRNEAVEAVAKKILATVSTSAFSKHLVKDAENAINNKTPASKRAKAVEKKILSFAQEFDLRDYFVKTSGIGDNDLDVVLEKSELPKILEQKVSE